MPVGTCVTRQMRSVRREGNRLTDHFLALRRVPSSANLDHLSPPRELPQGFARSQPHLLQLACIACHVRERLFSRPNADTFVRHGRPLITTRLDLYLPVGGQDWALDLVRCG